MPQRIPECDTIPFTMDWYVYMVRCCDGTFYIGCTSNIAARLHAHNYLKSGARYTRSRRPVELVYQETVPTHSAALKRERLLKKLSRREKEALLRNV